MDESPAGRRQHQRAGGDADLPLQRDGLLAADHRQPGRLTGQRAPGDVDGTGEPGGRIFSQAISPRPPERQMEYSGCPSALPARRTAPADRADPADIAGELDVDLAELDRGADVRSIRPLRRDREIG